MHGVLFAELAMLVELKPRLELFLVFERPARDALA